MSVTGWVPVDETASAWMPVAEAPPVKKTAGFFDKQSDFDPNYSALEEGAQPFIGAAKGAANTLFGGASLMNRGLRAAGHGLGLDSATDAFIPPFPTKPQELSPSTTGQKIGYGAEQAGEFALPGGALGRAGKAIDVATAGAGLLGKTGALLGKGALEGAAAGGITALQGGDVGTNAALGAVTPAIGGLGGFLAKKAPSVANKMLRPVPSQIEDALRFGRNPGQAIVDEGIIAKSLPDLVEKVTGKKAEVGQQINSVLSASNAAPIQARPLVEKPIDDMIQKVINGKVNGGQGLIDQLEEMRDTLASQRQLVNGKLQVAAPKNLDLSPVDAHALKVQVGEMTGWTGQGFDKELNQVRRKIYRNLNDAVQKAVPDVKPWQDRYGNLKEAEEAATHEYARHQSRNPFSLLDAGVATAGATAGALHGGTLEAALLGAALPAARHVIQSPLSRSLEIQALKNAPKAFNPPMVRGARNSLFGALSADQEDSQ